ncbi:stonustoxin subunit beta-like isoform X1 [Sander lucioperca]|uniref:stonustoxin subunit beta-like isoform X1 n=1 Tax=Sander lucioperca TaxID=283035 RepID=UPI001653B082|nr:stonustoxin subunit beta-like isoform X1 [Sander lucioperca]XP_035853318.1 stonustoxin subunit beta-like isoform X1 [Sander lucioperca]
MASDNKTVAALGRPFTLGMLYDARRDKLIPGLTLWDEKTLQGKITESSQCTSNSLISTSDSTESKCSLLDVEASLKASVLGGLIEFGGSAKYLNDKKKFHNQSRVTCQYKTTTNFKQLMIEQLTMDPQQMDVIKKSSATHVVTGILYGANAFFVFDSEKVEASSVQDIQVSMHAAINVLFVKAEAKAKVQLTDEQKTLTKKLSCKFYGDFILDSNPATFEDAVKAYEQLPHLLGEKGEKAVPVKVWLMPLKNFHSEGVELTGEINDSLASKAQYSLDDLKEKEIRCNDSIEDKVVGQFPQIREELSTFQKLCGSYASKLQQALAKKLPSIREGKEDESSLNKLFEDRDKSPFSQEKLTKWLDRKEREINVIRSCVDTMEGTKIVPNQSELDRQVLAPGVEDVLCFVFTSVEKGDTDLDVMADHLGVQKLGSTNEDPWYYSNEVFTKMREKAKAFHDLAKALKTNSRFRFLIAAIANKKHTGAAIYHYKNGILVTEDFLKPVLPPVETITDRRDLIWYACDLNLDPNTANYNLILSEGNKKATRGAWQKYPDHPERFTQIQQVLCKESLSGQHYWEVKWSQNPENCVSIAVAYREMDRKSANIKSQFGHNAVSWAFENYQDNKNAHILFALKNSQNVLKTPFPSDGCSRVGVYLDWPAGTLSFYRVSSNTLRHLYTFHTTFTEPVYPGLLVCYDQNYAYLCPLE